MNIERYVRLTLLDQKDTPKEQIEGRVTGGSINIDGASKFRRNCSLTLVAVGDEDMIHDELWALTHKFRLEIGDKQDNKDIVYYKQGVFIINSFSKSKSNNGFNISISGQDKMCLLNGTMGGQLAADHDFGTIEEIDSNGVSIITKLPLYTIIYQAMQTYGHERPENIIINDLDIDAFELWEYRGTEPMYYILNQEKDIITILFDKENVKKLDWYEEGFEYRNEVIHFLGSSKDVDLNTFKFYSYNTLDDDYNNNADIVNYQGTPAYIAKVETGHTAGFHKIPLVYNSDLVLTAGEPFTSLLDKIVGMLGPYEYFFDVDGRFVFQKKKTYIQELFSPKTGDIMNPLMTVSPYSYEIDNDKLNTQVSWSPKIDNVKNDFVVWGKKSSGARFHGRCAIDRKPTYYRTMQYYKPFNIFFLIVNNITKWNKESSIVPYVEAEDGYTIVPIEDRKAWTSDTVGATLGWKSVTVSNTWVEGITKESNQGWDRAYFVAIKNGYKERSLLGTYEKTNNDTYSQINTPNSWEAGTYYDWISPKDYSITNGDDWRELIYQMAVDFYRHNQKDSFYQDIIAPSNIGGQINYNKDYYPNGITGYEQYYTDMQAFWRLLYNPDGDWRQYYVDDPVTKLYDNNTESFNNVTDIQMANALRDLYDIKIGSPNKGFHVLSDFISKGSENCKNYVKNNDANSFYILLSNISNNLIGVNMGKLIEWNKNLSPQRYYNNSFRESPNGENKTIQDLLRTIYKNNNITNENLNDLLKACNDAINQGNITETDQTKKEEKIAQYKEELYYDIELMLNYMGWEVNIPAKTAKRKALFNPKLHVDQSDKNWNRAIHTDPESLLFWFEFLDSAGELDNYSVPQIGQKAKVENVENIQTIYYRERPEVQFIVSPEVYESTDTAYKPVWIPAAMQNLFVRSTEGISTIDKINDLIYQHSACSEGLNITCIPIWELQPNTRVRVRDNDYTLDKISCSLTYNGTMSLTLTKILTNFY